MREDIVVKESELPRGLQIIGNNGERKRYQLRPAGRKFGAFLCQSEDHRESITSQPER